MFDFTSFFILYYFYLFIYGLTFLRKVKVVITLKLKDLVGLQ